MLRFYRKIYEVARGQVRSKRGTLRPTPHPDRQYLQDNQVLLDQFRKKRSTNSGTWFEGDFCFSYFTS